MPTGKRAGTGPTSFEPSFVSDRSRDRRPAVVKPAGTVIAGKPLAPSSVHAFDAGRSRSARSARRACGRNVARRVGHGVEVEHRHALQRDLLQREAVEADCRYRTSVVVAFSSPSFLSENPESGRTSVKNVDFAIRSSIVRMFASPRSREIQVHRVLALADRRAPQPKPRMRRAVVGQRRADPSACSTSSGTWSAVGLPARVDGEQLRETAERTVRSR